MRKVIHFILTVVPLVYFSQKIEKDSLRKIAEKKIEEVTINGRKPSLETLSDRFIFNVENSGLVIGNNAWNVLQQTPLLMADENNGISVMGFQNATVYINGRKSILMGKDLYTYLKNMPADNLVKINIITTPSAKYDANDGAVIDLIVKRLDSDGYKGSVSFTDMQTRKNSQEIMAYLNYHNNRYSQSSNFDIGIDRRKSYEYNINKIYNQELYQNIDVIRNSKEYYLSTNNSFEYEINSESIVGGVIEFNFSNPRSQLNSKNYSFDKDLYFTSQNDNYNNLLISNNIFYKFQSKNLNNQSLEFNFDWVYRKSNGYGDYQSYDNLLLDAYNNIINEQRRNYSFKIDYSQELGNTGYSIETGIKNNFLNQNSPYYVNSWDGNEFIINNKLSNNFEYNENIFGIYGTISKNYFKNLSIKAGVRNEYTNLNGIQHFTSEKSRRHYTNWLPTIIATYKLKNKNSISVSYRKSIVRPYANELNPFIYYINNDYIRKGNPDLNIYKQDTYRLNYSFNKKFNFLVAFRINTDVMRSAMIEEDNKVLVQTINYQGNNYQFIAGFNYNGSLLNDRLIINFNPTITINNNSDINKHNNLNISNSTFTNFDLKLSYKNIINSGINSEVYFSFYYNYSLLNYQLTEPSNRLTLSLSKDFENQGIKVRLQAIDPFNFLTWKTNYYTNIGEMYKDNRRDLRSITLSVSKSFGNKKTKEIKNKLIDKGRTSSGDNTQ